jgi:hypothetical protein
VVAALGEPVEPPVDHLTHPLRDAEAEMTLAAETVLADEQTSDLAHEEGVTLALGVHGGYDLGRRFGPSGRGDASSNFGLAESAEDEAGGDRLTDELSQRVVQWIVAGYFDVSIGSDQEQAGVGQYTGHKLQQQQTRPVGPMKVVEDHHQTVRPRRTPQGAGHGVEEPEPGRLGVERGWRLQAGHHLGQLRQQLGHLGSPCPKLGPQGGSGTGGGERPQQLYPGPVGRRSVALKAAAPHHPRRARPGPGDELLGDAGLADTGLARHEHQPTLPAQSVLQRGAKPVQFSLAADEHTLGANLGCRRKRCRQPADVGMHQREHVLRSRQALQPMPSDIGQLDPDRQLIRHQVSGRPRQQNLTSLGKRPQARCAVQRLPVVVALAQLGLPGMHRHTGWEVDPVRPGFGQQSSL